MDTSSFISRYGAAVQAFNRDDVAPLGALLAEGCTFVTSRGPVGSSRDEIVAALRQGRAAGWVSHNTIAMVGAGEFVITLFRNDASDGSSLISAGMIRLDADGNAIDIHTFEPEQPPGWETSSTA